MKLLRLIEGGGIELYIKIKIILGAEIINIIDAYAPQIGLEESIKQKTFGGHGWIDSRVSEKEKNIIGGDLNGRVGKNSGGIQTSRVHGGHGYGVRNELRDAKLDFATTYDLILRNI